MESVKEKKQATRNKIATMLEGFSTNKILEKTKAIENRLFEFANFLEAQTVLLYMNRFGEVNTMDIIKKCFDYEKTVALPGFNAKTHEMVLMKVDNVEDDLHPGSTGILEPDTSRCKVLPVESIDIAIIPGIALDEKGSRLGSGHGYYDRLIPKLSITTRKVAIAFEEQIVQHVPTESHDKHVDIVITDQRIIFKI
jgi:5-formyltetrahydrofolate cyclo-ligase